MFKDSEVQKGFNSDINIGGKRYHIQTEDWGESRSCLITQVFRNGAVIKSFKLSYADALKSGPVSQRAALRLAMEMQHYQILDLVQSGQL